MQKPPPRAHHCAPSLQGALALLRRLPEEPGSSRVPPDPRREARLHQNVGVYDAEDVGSAQPDPHVPGAGEVEGRAVPDAGDGDAG